MKKSKSYRVNFGFLPIINDRVLRSMEWFMNISIAKVTKVEFLGG